jgi:Na+/H+ antiporter NhaC
MIADDVSGIEPVSGSPRLARDFLVPIAAMIVIIFAGLWITGDGNMMEGSGSTSVLWAVSGAIAVAMILYALPGRGSAGNKILSIGESTELVLKGSAGLVPVTVLVVMAFALGQISRELGMGPYLAGLIGSTGNGWWIPAVVFVVGCVVSFTLGSSWTAFAVMVPVALPLVDTLGIQPGLMLGAILSGGVFGDHASPLSDTSIISSMASASDHVDHINTQLPYAGVVALASVLLFLVSGLLM